MGVTPLREATKEDGQSPAYRYLMAVADRLDSKYARVANLGGHCADKVRDVVARKCRAEWDDVITKALDSDYPADDIRAAWHRIESGKNFLKFLRQASNEA